MTIGRLEEKDFLIFGMKNILLEKKLEKLEKEGIEIGHLKTLEEKERVDVELFEKEILQEAKKMADFYVLYYSLENSIRKLVEDVLKEKHGENWWEDKVPEGVKQTVSKNKDKEKNSPMTMRSNNLSYTNFGELKDIILSNWRNFAIILRSKSSVETVLSQLNTIRSIVAHSCKLDDDEIIRLELLIKDWLRIQN